MLITLSRRTAICQSVVEVQLTGVAPLGAVSQIFNFFKQSILHQETSKENHLRIQEHTLGTYSDYCYRDVVRLHMNANRYKQEGKGGKFDLMELRKSSSFLAKLACNFFLPLSNQSCRRKTKQRKPDSPPEHNFENSNLISSTSIRVILVTYHFHERKK